jgi:hypothetical protein
VTLHLPPPDIRTLDKNRGPFSSKMTPQSRAASAQAMAAKKPAAPPPTTMTRVLMASNLTDSPGNLEA